jgi:hypothetical protein
MALAEISDYTANGTGIDLGEDHDFIEETSPY